MSIAIWVIQWALTGYFALWGLAKLAKAASESEAERRLVANRRGFRYVSRGGDAVAGFRNLACAAGLVFPAFGTGGTDQGWMIVIAALLLLYVMGKELVWFWYSWGFYAPMPESLVFVLLVAVLVLRAGPYRIG